jgi:hypothetical protein
VSGTGDHVVEVRHLDSFFLQADPSLLDHPKIVRLMARFGEAGVVSLYRLWSHAAKFNSDGRFKNVTAKELGLIARAKRPEMFIRFLVDTRLLDQEDGVYAVHGWQNRQPFLATTEERSARNQRNAIARWSKGGDKTLSELRSESADLLLNLDRNSHPISKSTIYSNSSKSTENIETSDASCMQVESESHASRRAHTNDPDNPEHKNSPFPLAKGDSLVFSSDRKRKSKTTKYPPEFELAFTIYPQRPTGDSKPAAYKAWHSRIRAGVTAAEMLDGLNRYVGYVRDSGKTETDFILRASTFFGPDERWKQPWLVANRNGKPRTYSETDWMPSLANYGGKGDSE